MHLKLTPKQLLTAAVVLVLGLFSRQECLAQTTTWEGSDPATVAAATETDENTVFLYNVSTGKFLNCGGFWGVAAVTSDVGLEFTVTSQPQQSGRNQTTVYIFKSKMLAQNASTSGAFQEIETCLTFDNNEKQYILDRSVSQATGNSTQYYGKFTLTKSTNGYTFIANNRYMAAGRASDATNVVDSDNPVTGFSSQPSSGAEWKLVTLKERKQAFMKVSDAVKTNVPATFLIYDNDFARRNAYISSWNGGTTALDYKTNTSNEGAVTPSNQSLTYYVGNGVADEYDNSYKWTGNVKGQGDLNQKIEPFRHGWYEIRCRAFATSSTAVLYASVGGATKASSAKLEYAEAKISNVSSTPSTYIAANDEVNKTATATDGSNYYPYEVVVRVYVRETSSSASGSTSGDIAYETCQSLTLGVKNPNGGSSDWICVDNFELEYLGEGTNNIILDETQPDITYINEQVNGKNSTIYLNRSLTANAWNSIILPFDMNQSDIVDIFGSGTLVSKYKGSNGSDQSTIYFEQTTSIEAGKLYIVKPTVGEPANDVYVESDNDLTLATMDADGNVTKNSQQSKLKLEKNYYTIPNIVFGKLNADGTKVEFDAQVKDNNASLVYGGPDYTFAGTYVKKLKVAPKYSYLLQAQSKDEHTGSTSQWLFRTKETSSLGFRGWLQPTPENTDAANSKMVFVNNINGVEETTAIDGVTADEMVKAATAGVYNLNGQLVSNNATKTGSLPKGLYIVNGKKVVVR